MGRTRLTSIGTPDQLKPTTKPTTKTGRARVDLGAVTVQTPAVSKDIPGAVPGKTKEKQ
jgi:hypothetical protein